MPRPPDHAPHVSVIIVTWNGREHLASCLPALFAQQYPDFEVIVVDNGSSDDTLDFLQSHFPQVRLIVNASNRGFAAANNQGILASTGEWVALLNNDTEVAPDWLAALVSAGEADPAIGMVAAKMLLADQPAVIDSVGIAVDRAGLAWGVAGGLADAPDIADTPGEVFGASGGAALYRRKMLAEIGLFDEDFFAYLEDVDLAWRAQWAGWRGIYTPAAVVLHRHSATSNRVPHLKSRLLGRNKVCLLAKNYPFPPLLWYLPLIILYEMMALAVAFKERRLRSALAGRLAGLLRLPAIVAKRRRRITRVSAAAMLARLERVATPVQILRRYRHVAKPTNVADKTLDC